VVLSLALATVALKRKAHASSDLPQVQEPECETDLALALCVRQPSRQGTAPAHVGLSEESPLSEQVVERLVSGLTRERGHDVGY
jgi:hypothetical protein